MTWTETAQPVVDLVRGVVVGYELLGPGGAPARMSAARLPAALAARRDLPEDCFLVLALDPSAAGSAEATDVLGAHGDLAGVVVALSASGADPSPEVTSRVARLRRSGALVALDHVGTAAGLAHVLDLRPEILRLDGTLVAGVDRDEARRAVVEGLGAVADRIDAWILAGDVETEGELACLAACGVPLAQGAVLGAPGRRGHRWRRAPERCWGAVRAPDEPLRPLVQRAPTVRLGRTDRAAAFADDGIDVTVVVDAADRPVGVLTPEAALTGDVRPALRGAHRHQPRGPGPPSQRSGARPDHPGAGDRSERALPGRVTLRRLLAHLGAGEDG